VVSATALVMAWRRVALTSAERTWCARQKPSRVARRARGAAVRGGAAAQEGAKDRGLCLVTPLPDLREGVFERAGEAMRQADCGADQATAGLDEVRPGTPRGAVWGERGERVPVCEEECALECGRGGGLLGPAGGKRCTVRGQGKRLNGQEHEEILVAERGNHGPFMQLQAHSHRLSVAPRPQGAAPRSDRFRAVLEDEKLAFRRAGGLYAALVCSIRPVKANEGGKILLRHTLQVSPPRGGYRGPKGHACWRSAQALERAGSAADSEDALTDASALAEAQLCA
jgi:hypothetical protein